MLPDEIPPHELRCPHCDWTTLCRPAEMLHWLQGVGKLRRAKEPPLEMVVELFTTAAEQFRCPECQQSGLLAAVRQQEDDGDEDWGMARRCAACQEVIPTERLEVFPDERLCAACKAAGADPAGPEEVEYCRHCGGIMVLRQKGGAGIARYAMSCSECRR